ncbi:MAG: DUF58 domain-containing protein [Thermoguttaceae bacterium]
MFQMLAGELVARALYLVFPGIFLFFLLLAVVFKTYPSTRAILLLCVDVFISIISMVLGNAFPYFLTYGVDLLVLSLLIADWIPLLAIRRDIVARRETESVAALGRPHPVTIVVENHGRRTIRFEMTDDTSSYATTLPPLETLEELTQEQFQDFSPRKSENPYAHSRFRMRFLGGDSKETFSYRLLWNSRGIFSFEFVALRFLGPLGLWRKYRKLPCKSEFHVYPNLCQLARQDFWARKSELLMPGVRRSRRVGLDAEFERLRDYTTDDQYKFIDWRATARRNKLTVRDFQTSRNQRVILALDAGRMMMNRSEGLSLFDGALNATLALAYIALRQGDEVGCLVFSNEVKRFIPPQGGASHINSIIRGVFDVFPEQVESRYDRAFGYLKTHSPKRALVVLATNVLDQRNAEQTRQCLVNLCGAHLPLGLFLREHSLFDAVERYEDLDREIREGALLKNSLASGRLALYQEQYREQAPVDEIERYFKNDGDVLSQRPEDVFFRAGAAAEILNWRRETLINLEARGVLTLDVFPEDATAPLVNKYLEIKARSLL